MITPGNDVDVVQFGQSLTFVRTDGRQQTFRIVGEDEADPSNGLVSHVSPLAKAVLGRRRGDIVRVGAREIEILDIGLVTPLPDALPVGGR